MKHILKALNDYREREFENEPMSWGEFIDLILLNHGYIYLAYTEDDNGEPMQTAYDVKNCEYVHIYKGEEKDREKADLETFVHDLEVCEFDDFIRDVWLYVED